MLGARGERASGGRRRTSAGVCLAPPARRSFTVVRRPFWHATKSGLYPNCGGERRDQGEEGPRAAPGVEGGEREGGQVAHLVEAVWVGSLGEEELDRAVAAVLGRGV